MHNICGKTISNIKQKAKINLFKSENGMNQKTCLTKTNKTERQLTRMPFFQKSYFTINNSTDKQVNECMIFNISSQGIKFHSLSRINVGKKVKILINNRTRFLKIDAEIVWCSIQSGFLYGTRLLNQSLELDEFIPE